MNSNKTDPTMSMNGWMLEFATILYFIGPFDQVQMKEMTMKAYFT